MADAKQVIELIFKGVDETGAATQAAINNSKAFATNVAAGTQPLADFTTSAVKTEAALIAAGLAVTAFAVKISGDFDTAFREISTLIDAPAESINNFKQEILDYASESTQPLESITQAIYSTISAGTDYADSIALVSEAEQLSVAGRADLNDSLVVLASSLNAYGLGAEDAARFSDALFTTVKLGQTTLPELAANLATVTGTAATLEVPFETILASIATLTAAGTPTAQAVTQINAVLSALLKPSTDASKAAKELGIEFSAQALKAKGLPTLLNEIAVATKGDEAEMARLFPRVEALKAVFPLTGTQAGKFAENLEGLTDSAGATGTAFETMSGSIDLAAQKVKNNLELLFVNIGTPLLDEANGIADGISGIFKALADAAGTDGSQFGELIAFIESQFGKFADTLATVAENLPAALDAADLSGFSDGLQAVGDAFGVLFDGVDLTTVDGLAAAITFVATAFENLSEFTGGVIESFKPLFDIITDTGAELNNLGPEFFKTAGEIGGAAVQVNLASKAFLDLIPAIEAIVGLIGVNQAIGLAGSLKGLVPLIAGKAGLIIALGGIAPVAAAAGVGIGTLINKITEAVAGQSLSTLITDFLIWSGAIDDEATNIVNSLNEIGSVELNGEQITREIESADAAMESLAGNADEGAEKFYNFSTGLFEVGEAARSSEDNLIAADKKLADLGLSSEDAANSFGKFGEAGEALKGTFSVVSNDFAKVSDSLSKTAEQIEQISIEEKLELIKAQSAITVAGVEADAAKTVAAFESISNSVTSTGESITELFGLLAGDGLSRFQEIDIEKQIDLENERREEALALQKELTEAQIREANARTEAFRRGTAAINVDGAGLQPHLEAFMFEILQSIQVEVNAQGYEMLLGSGGA